MDFAAQDMSGELQTVPARHGVATFVPRGRTIKVINTYGKQVVSVWAIGLGAPPEEGESDAEEEEIEEHAEELKEELAKVEAENDQEQGQKGKEKEKESGDSTETESTSKEVEEEADDPPEQAPDTPQNEKSTDATAKSTETTEKSTETTQKSTETTEKTQAAKRTWASYLPSMPYRSKAQANKNDNEGQAQAKEEKAQNEATSRKWSSYLPTGKAFSSYVPNVQIPDSKDVVSAFKSSHYRDPNKSYAEQLYDFSKTPVGAGGIAAATGSGTASSIYAAYNAYVQLSPSKRDQPPMEYLSLPHTRASTHRLVPEVNDTLLTNLRNPIMTLVEDTTPGAHDTLTAACDANLYAALGVEKPAEHGSCAENLVIALKQLNEKAGLKGAKSIGADITVNIAPTPLHLFMNAPIDFDESAKSENGAGAKGATLKVDEPKAKKRSFVRFKAERDIVIVLSACPMDVGSQNGGKCMAANFMVEEASEDLSSSKASIKKEKSVPRKLGQGNITGEPKKEQPAAKPKVEQKIESRRDSAADDPPESELPEEEKKDAKAKVASTTSEDTPKPKRKPKKLERRGGSSAQTKTLSS